jgi:hypothetical protein
MDKTRIAQVLMQLWRPHTVHLKDVTTDSEYHEIKAYWQKKCPGHCSVIDALIRMSKEG